jgi:hypothetical protein
MKFFNLVALGSAALVLISSLPSACGAAVAVERRDVASDAVSILNNAKNQITPIKNELLSKYSSGDFNDEDFVRNELLPLVSEMSRIVANAAGQITTLRNSNSRRQVNTGAVANALAALIREVVEALEPLLDFLNGISLIAVLLGPFIASLGNNLNTIAIGLGILLAGVLELVRDLLTSLTNALSGLGWLNLLAALGL